MALQKETIYVGIVALLVGIILAGGMAALAVNNNNRRMMKMMGMDTSRIKDDSAGHMGMSMNDMTSELHNRKGDDFDANFIAMMIAHHQGAIEMAQLAEGRAKHQEIKQLSKDILSAQTQEVERMGQWQADWGYDNNIDMHGTH